MAPPGRSRSAQSTSRSRSCPSVASSRPRTRSPAWSRRTSTSRWSAAELPLLRVTTSSRTPRPRSRRTSTPARASHRQRSSSQRRPRWRTAGQPRTSRTRSWASGTTSRSSAATSARTLLAADFTVLTTNQVAASQADLTSSIILSIGCHSGYNIVDGQGIQGITNVLDWPQVFAQKGATSILGTGYQYGDTDYVAYSEQIYAGIADQLRYNTYGDVVDIGDALLRSSDLKQNPNLGDLHEKALLEATLYGIPMLGVDMPTGRIAAPDNAGSVSLKSDFTNPEPAQTTGLKYADIDPNTTDRAKQVKDLNVDGGGTIKATWYEGAGGKVLTTPGAPILPLFSKGVTSGDSGLRASRDRVPGRQLHGFECGSADGSTGRGAADGPYVLQLTDLLSHADVDGELLRRTLRRPERGRHDPVHDAGAASFRQPGRRPGHAPAVRRPQPPAVLQQQHGSQRQVCGSLDLRHHQRPERRGRQRHLCTRRRRSQGRRPAGLGDIHDADQRQVGVVRSRSRRPRSDALGRYAHPAHRRAVHRPGRQRLRPREPERQLRRLLPGRLTGLDARAGPRGPRR